MPGGTRSTINPNSIDSFGAIDADTDKLLEECFQSHRAYTRAFHNDSFLILGRKGSGKTAIFRRLVTDTSENHYASGLTFDDYPWAHHDLQAEGNVPEERRYLHSWKYLMLIELSKILLKQAKTKTLPSASKDALKPIGEFIKDSYGTNDPDVRHLFRPGSKLHFGAAIKVGILTLSGKKLPMSELPRHFSEVNRVIQDRILSALDGSSRYYVCFDALDLGFSWTMPQYAHRLTGLILAARDLFIAAKRANKKLNIVVFLRNDIYHELHFEDKNKITEELAVSVEWSKSGTGLTLKQLMERRFAAALGRTGVVPWDQLFDETQELGNTTKYNHICNRTFLRPRDMIKFCNEVLAAHKRLERDRGARFDNDAVIAARAKFSSYLLNELDDEIAKHVPNYRSYLNVLRLVGKERFTLTDLTEKWNGSPDVKGVSAVEGLESLFDFSVIGCAIGVGSDFSFRYLDTMSRFDPTAETYRVHPGFKEVLSLRSR